MIPHPLRTSQVATRRTPEAHQGVTTVLVLHGRPPGSSRPGSTAPCLGTTIIVRHRLMPRRGPTPTRSSLPLLLGDCPIDRGE